MLHITHRWGNVNENRNEMSLTAVRMTKFNNMRNSRCWRGRRERGAPLPPCMGGTQTGAAALEARQGVRIELPYDPAAAPAGIYPENTELLMHRGTGAPTFTAAASTRAKLQKQPQCPAADACVKKTHVCKLNGVSLCYRKEWNLAVCSGRDGARELCVSEIGQSEKDESHTASSCGV